MPQVAETYIPRRAIRHMQKDRVVIFGAGAGLPYFSTDTVAAQRALEIHADEVLVAKNGVDGIYTADPNKDPNAERLYNLTYDEAMQRNIRVLDQTAFSLCRDNNVTMRVFGMQGEGNVTRAILGEKDGYPRYSLTPNFLGRGMFDAPLIVTVLDSADLFWTVPARVSAKTRLWPRRYRLDLYQNTTFCLFPIDFAVSVRFSPRMRRKPAGNNEG